LRIAERQFDLFRNREQFRQVHLERRHDVFNARVSNDREGRFGAIDLCAGARLTRRIAIGIDLAFGTRRTELACAFRRLDFDRTTAGAIAFALHASGSAHVARTAAFAGAGAVATTIALIAEHIVAIAGTRSFASTLADAVAGDRELRGAFALRIARRFAAAREFTWIATRNDLRRGNFTRDVRAAARFATSLQTRIDRARRGLESDRNARLTSSFLDFGDRELAPSIYPQISLRFRHALGIGTEVRGNGLARVGNVCGHARSRRRKVGHRLHQCPVINVGLTSKAPVDSRQIVARNELRAAERLLRIGDLVTTDHRDEDHARNSKRDSEQANF